VSIPVFNSSFAEFEILILGFFRDAARIRSWREAAPVFQRDDRRLDLSGHGASKGGRLPIGLFLAME
jgi:hypothetical protein